MKVINDKNQNRIYLTREYIIYIFKIHFREVKFLFYNIIEVPELNNLSKKELNEKLKLEELQGHIVKKDGFTYIDEEAFNFIKNNSKESKESKEEGVKDLVNTLTEQLKEKDMQIYELNERLKQEQELNKNNQLLLLNKPQDKEPGYGNQEDEKKHYEKFSKKKENKKDL